MDKKTAVALSQQYPGYISIHANVLKCVNAHLSTLEQLRLHSAEKCDERVHMFSIIRFVLNISRSSGSLLKLFDAVINESVAKVRKDLPICVSPKLINIWIFNESFRSFRLAPCKLV